MTTEQKEGSRAIAEFMGYKFNDYPDLRHNNVTKPNESEWFYASWEIDDYNDFLAGYFKYHSSWDWLMPVIEKISQIKYPHYWGKDWEGEKPPYTDNAYPRTFGMLSDEGKPMFRFNCCALFIADTLIEAAWLAVINFIRWYNLQSTPPKTSGEE